MIKDHAMYYLCISFLFLLYMKFIRNTEVGIKLNDFIHVYQVQSVDKKDRKLFKLVFESVETFYELLNQKII